MNIYDVVVFIVGGTMAVAAALCAAPPKETKETMTGLLLLPVITWALEDARWLCLTRWSLVRGYVFALTLVLVSAMTAPPALAVSLPSMLLGIVVARIAFPLADALVVGYIGLVLGPIVFLVLALVLAILRTVPYHRALDMPAIPLIAAVTSVVACAQQVWGVV